MGKNVAQLIMDDYLEIMGKLNVQGSTRSMVCKVGLEEL